MWWGIANRARCGPRRSPNNRRGAATDPPLGQILEEADEAGVEKHGFGCLRSDDAPTWVARDAVIRMQERGVAPPTDSPVQHRGPLHLARPEQPVFLCHHPLPGNSTSARLPRSGSMVEDTGRAAALLFARHDQASRRKAGGTRDLAAGTDSTVHHIRQRRCLSAKNLAGLRSWRGLQRRRDCAIIRLTADVTVLEVGGSVLRLACNIILCWIRLQH